MISSPLDSSISYLSSFVKALSSSPTFSSKRTRQWGRCEGGTVERSQGCCFISHSHTNLWCKFPRVLTVKSCTAFTEVSGWWMKQEGKRIWIILHQRKRQGTWEMIGGKDDGVKGRHHLTTAAQRSKRVRGDSSQLNFFFPFVFISISSTHHTPYHTWLFLMNTGNLIRFPMSIHASIPSLIHPFICPTTVYIYFCCWLFPQLLTH